MSLKDDLLKSERPIPEYRIMLPPGWTEYLPDNITEQELLREAKIRLRDAHRPDLAAELVGMTKRAFSQMRRTKALAFYMGVPPDEGNVLPLSITVTKRVAANGFTFDSEVADLIRNQGATPLNDDQVVLRWETSQTHTVGRDKITTETISYLTPIPGTERREALMFVGVVPHPFELSRHDSVIESYVYACDVIMSTFSWGKK
jgi:hypothetical protein